MAVAGQEGNEEIGERGEGVGETMEPVTILAQPLPQPSHCIELRFTTLNVAHFPFVERYSNTILNTIQIKYNFL